MKKVKELFSSPRNVVIAIVCMAAGLAVVAGGVKFAAEARGKSGSLDRTAALRFALADAGVAESEITVTKQKLGQEDGKNYYEIDFYTSDYLYEYEIDAVTGAVAGVSIEARFGAPAGGAAGAGGQTGQQEGVQGQPGGGQSGQPGQSGSGQGQSGEQGQTGSQSGDGQGQPGSSQGQPGQAGQSAGGQGQSGSSQQDGKVTLDVAKSMALSDAGVSESAAAFTKTQLDWDDGIEVYEIEFYTSEAEYDYEINAATGAIVSRDVENFQHGEQPGSHQGHSGVHAGQQDQSGGQGQSGASDSYIGETRAKEIAASHAGFQVSEVVFTKAELDWDDGVAEYEVEFLKDRTEYEYSIDAVTGAVLEHEQDHDHD